MQALLFKIRALEPLLLRRPECGEENSGKAWGFIPGSVIRGFLCSRYIEQKQLRDAAADPECHRLFFSGKICFLNAYPLSETGRRCLPRPLSWFSNKDDLDNREVLIHDLALAPDRLPANPRRLGREFCWTELEEGTVELLDARREITMHNASSDRMVKGKGSSNLFTYDALERGQSFGAAIISAQRTDLEIIATLLGDEGVLGGSTHAAYGRAIFEEQNPKIVDGWAESEIGEGQPETGLVVTLLSDAIVRDGCGQVSASPKDLLGIDPGAVFSRIRMVGGFNRKWGLPLKQEATLTAGSVFVFKFAEDLRRRIEQLVETGVGERRLDGFGRIAFNWQSREEWSWIKRSDRPKASASPVLQEGTAGYRLAQVMNERMLRSDLEQRLAWAVNNLEMTGEIGNSQLSRLRLLAREAWSSGSWECIEKFLRRFRQPARIQLERARVNNQPLLDWLQAELIKGKVWKDYFDIEISSVGGVVPAETDCLRVEFSARLLDGLAKKLIRHKQAVGGDNR
jgi:CRISPR-associated protein Csx10